MLWLRGKYSVLVNCSLCMQTQLPFVEADRKGYEEGGKRRISQERERWLAGLEEIVRQRRRERKNAILKQLCFCCCCCMQLL